MATAASGSTESSVRRQPEASGWVIFAAVMLFVSGTFGVIWGLAAVLNDKVVTVGGQGVLIADFTTWGWIHIVVGAVMIVTSLGLFGAREWARWTAIFFAMLQAILQVGIFPAFPLWSLVVIALDVVVIYQLTTHYESV
jgi:amino acid transporter